MKLPKKVIIIIAAVLICLVGGGIVFATNTPTARAQRQLNLGNKYLQEGKYQEAILAFQKVIEIEPKNIPARLGLGKAYVATNEYDKAETILKEVIDIDQNNLQARKDLFEVYLKEGKLDEANALLQEISKLDPGIDMGQYTTELKAAEVISASIASYDQGIKQMNDKQYLAAVDSFQKVVKEDSQRYDDAQAKISECKKAFFEETLQKAKDAAVNKDNKTALDLIEQVLKVDSNNEEALKLKSEYTNSMNDLQQQAAAKAAFADNSELTLEEAFQIAKASFRDTCYRDGVNVNVNSLNVRELGDSEIMQDEGKYALEVSYGSIKAGYYVDKKTGKLYPINCTDGFIEGEGYRSFR